MPRRPCTGAGCTGRPDAGEGLPVTLRDTAGALARLCFVSCGFCWASPALHAQPLPELFRSTLAADPAVSAAQAQVRAAEERLTQARAALMPSVAATVNRTETRYDEAPSFE